jgi:hypothetical protein
MMFVYIDLFLPHQPIIYLNTYVNTYICLIVSQREIIVIDTYHTTKRDCFGDKLRLDTSDRFDEFCIYLKKYSFTYSCDINEYNRKKERKIKNHHIVLIQKGIYQVLMFCYLFTHV